eukprot:403335995
MSYKLHYLPVYSRAEPIRMLFSHAKVQYEEINYQFEDLAGLKGTGKFEFGQIPAIEKDGKMYVQSQAILRYLGVTFNYYPQDAYQAYLVDSILDSVNDIQNTLYKAAFHPNEETKAALIADFLSNTLPRFISAFDKRLEGNTTGFIVGDQITIADFALAAFAYSLFLNEICPVKAQIEEVVKRFENFYKYSLGLGEHVKAHLDTRKPAPW